MFKMIFPNKWVWPVEVKTNFYGLYLEQVSLLLGLPPIQVNSGSNLQSELHPSPFMLFPSSHSKENLFPSPQI